MYVYFKNLAGLALSRNILSRSAGLKPLTTFCGRLSSSGKVIETYLKQFTIGRFALKRQLPRQAEGPGLPRFLSSLSRYISCCGDATIAHSSIENELANPKVSSSFLSLFLPQPHPSTSTEPPIHPGQAEHQA